MGYNVVVSDTNLDKKYHIYWENLAKEAGYEFEVKYFEISLEEAYKRDLRRGGKAVGRDVLNKQWKQWLNITNRRTYNPTRADKTSKTNVVLVDLDGTVCEKGDRSPFDWAKVGLDTPRQEIINLISSYCWATQSKPVFVSGRDAVCRKESEEWLYNNLPMSLSRGSIELYMRPEGDSRKDSIVKEEIFWELVNKYYVNLVFDDRLQVIRMWQDLGLTVINVGADYLEF